MHVTHNIHKSIFLILIVGLALNFSHAQTNMYWVGGSGDWTDINHWVKTSGGSNITGLIPNEDYNAVIDGNSGLTSGSTINIPPGAYAVNDLIITNTSGFTLLLGGTSLTNKVEMFVYGDLDFSSGFNLDYAIYNSYSNKWKFKDGISHNISTGSQDLLSVEFLTENVSYKQLSPLLASEKIRMYAGTWITNGHDINTKFIHFKDTNPSSNPLTKTFYTASSNIYCDEWDSQLTYGSFTVNGPHNIYVKKFTGSPSGAGATPFEYDVIHLLEYQDNPPSGTSIVEHNNFECTHCEIEKIFIEDTGITKLAGKFTINEKLSILNPESIIQFNGGNNRLNEVIINGVVNTPNITGCEKRTIFTNAHTEHTILTRTSGTLTINDAIINNIQTNGGVIFNASNSVLQGNSAGWNIINPPTGLSYVWNGPSSGYGDWDNPGNWTLQSGGSNGCLPTIIDDVLINSSSTGNIRIPHSFTAECKNFYWTNTNNLDLKLDGMPVYASTLKVTGNLELDNSATITPDENHSLTFSTTSSNHIITNSVSLPNIKFLGDSGQWNLLDDLTCDKLYFEGGTFNTQSNDVETDYWASFGYNPRHYNFGSSQILVNGEFIISQFPTSNITVTPGTSLIICEELTSSIEHLHDVKLINSTSLSLNNYPYNFNKLILNGTGQVSTQNNLILNDLIFESSGSILALDDASEFHINGEIESQASLSNPAILKSKTTGIHAEVDRDTGNICAIGHIAFQDIDAILDGVLNAPSGIDNGNNIGINFDDGTSTFDLYWIGGTGEWQIPGNWSRVSGGCPSVKDPENMDRLFFDNNSFFKAEDTISVPFASSCDEMYFYNSQNNVTFMITSGLNPNLLEVSGGTAKMNGKYLFVNGVSEVNNGGILTTNMLNFTTESMNSTGGIYVLKAGSTASIGP